MHSVICSSAVILSDLVQSCWEKFANAGDQCRIQINEPLRNCDATFILLEAHLRNQQFLSLIFCHHICPKTAVLLFVPTVLINQYYAIDSSPTSSLSIFFLVSSTSPYPLDHFVPCLLSFIIFVPQDCCFSLI